MMTIGEALGTKLRNVIVTETAIRSRMRIAKPGAAAVDVVNGFIEKKNRAHHVEPSIASNGTRTVRSKTYSSTSFSTPENVFLDYTETRDVEEGGDINVRLDLAGEALELQVDVQRKMGMGSALALSTPTLLQELANDPNVGLREPKNNDPILAKPIELFRGDTWLRERIFRADRTLAIIAIGYPAVLDDYTIQTLAERVCGIAHVVVLRDVAISFDITDSFDRTWSVFNSGIRIYGPGLSVADEARRAARLVLPDRFSGPAGTFTSTLNEIVASAGRYVQSHLVDHPMPSRESAIERARAASRVEDPPALTMPDFQTIEAHTIDDVDTVVLEQNSTPDDSVTSLAIAEGLYRERLAELQTEIDAFRKSNSLLTEEHDYQKQLAESYEQTARAYQQEVQRLTRLVQPLEDLERLTPAWRERVMTILAAGVAASDQERRNDDLEESLATSRAHLTVLEHRLAQEADAVAPIARPQPQHIESLLAYLAAKYPGVFAIFGQGSRSYKKVEPYGDQDRFLEALDVLGSTYYAWKTAAPEDVLDRQRAFEERCTALSLKNTPSATTRGYEAYPDEHTVRLTGGRKTTMYELRDVGTTMEARHMLYIGYAWDEEAGQVVIARFDHPVVLCART
jgi:hypothetical protein